MRTESIETPTHGRVLVRDATSPSAVLLGFHGYMENAEIQMERLVFTAGTAPWMLISVQGLHRFYRGRTQDVVASWMTRQDREDMIADNIEYVARVVDRFVPADVPFFTIGFSQGVATAFRGGVRGHRPATGIIAVGGDVPPELLEDESLRFPAVLLARGDHDEWYTPSKMDSDVARFGGRCRVLETTVYAGGHEWTPVLGRGVTNWIRRQL